MHEDLTIDAQVKQQPNIGCYLLLYHDGGIRYETYRGGLTESDRHVVHSVTKTLTTMMIGVAIDEAQLDPNRPFRSYVPELTAAVWDSVTLQHVLDMAVGIDTEENYHDPASMYWAYAGAVGYYGSTDDPAGALAFVVDNFETPDTTPGERFNYSSPLTNLLPLCLEAVYTRGRRSSSTRNGYSPGSARNARAPSTLMLSVCRSSKAT